MPIEVDLDIITQYCCLEPEIGEALLYLYPEFLSDEQRAAFERHLEGCEFCQERRKLWQATGLDVRAAALLKQVKVLFTERRYEQAVGLYNQTLSLQGELWDRPEGRECFQAGAKLSLTAARSKKRDILPYFDPRSAPGAHELAAAAPHSIFPLTVEYAEGKVKGNISTLGRQVFFELQDVSDEFRDGIVLVGKILRPAPLLKSWELTLGEKQRLGTLNELFGGTKIELPQVIDSVAMFQVLAR